MADQLQSQEVGDFIEALTDDVSRLRKCYGNIATMLDRDMAAIQTLRSSVRTELNRVEVAGRILDAVKKGTTAEMAYNRTYSIVRYFTEKEGEFRTRAAEYAQRLAEIEDHVASLARSQPPSPHAVAETIRAQNNSFLLLASQVAALHNQVEKLRDQYLVYRRQYHGDGKNPFGKAGKKKKRASSVVAAEGLRHVGNSVSMELLPTRADASQFKYPKPP
ncbi:hypothetical protein AMAG_10604 [Allomyces macrogynus ATCC 38327]|uniref:Uncharacterized protein n=1 Tax=Allomyces macrogynus (strain ATCC 38327) TaxID=578462 RepID=A0A0L0SRF5_ALLM3|nr:hypothetical protein AMAG_10604 [Allomyces macrogynus ATCC 38327]|eukprot:KNE64939.1 hypothetical protein AMAG_10604 [Allomyces macrogynus ATCC 38327]